MTSGTPDQITVRTFSRTFEKMCNFIAIARTGDPRATIRGLVTLCLFEFPEEHFDGAERFRVTIETLFGLPITDAQIEAALDELEEQHVVTRPGNTNYRLEVAALASLKHAIDDSRALEYRVKSGWFCELEVSYPKLPKDQAWQVLRAYLCGAFRRHGIQAAALLDPTVDTPAEHTVSLTSILHQAINEHGFQDRRLCSDAERAISDFMAALGTDPNRARYITQLADGAFNFYTLAVPSDLSEQLRQQLHELTLFLDTNFLFGILNLHYNTQVQVSHDLLRAISEHKLPFKLRYHEATKEEMTSTILYYGAILRSRSWSRSLSRAAAASRNLSGIEQKFHERNSSGLIDVGEFLRPYEHFDIFLAEQDIRIFRPHEQRAEARNALFHEYQDFLRENSRRDKPYGTVMHDAKVLEEARNLRMNAGSSLEAGALLISCDYFLYRFDWETSRNEGRRACVLLPNIFWQILRPFIPADQNFDKAFAETFALPEFRAIGSGGSRASSKMLQILATYKEVPESTAMKMLANDLLLDRLQSEHDDAKFAEQVEAAFVEENRSLLEEMASLERELKRLEVLAEEKSRGRHENSAALDGKSKQLDKAREEAAHQVNAANRATADYKEAVKDAAQRAEKAEKVASDERQRAEIEAQAKVKAERDAFRMSAIAGIATGMLGTLLFLVLTQALPWTWLASHGNAIPLQIGASLILMCASTGCFVRAWRYWCWGVAGLTLLGTLLLLMSK